MFGESFHTLENGTVSDYIRVLGSILQGGGIGAELPVVKAIGRYIPMQACRDMFRGNDFIIDYGKEAVRRMKVSVGAGNVFANMVAQVSIFSQCREHFPCLHFSPRRQRRASNWRSSTCSLRQPP